MSERRGTRSQRLTAAEKGKGRAVEQGPPLSSSPAAVSSPASNGFVYARDFVNGLDIEALRADAPSPRSADVGRGDSMAGGGGSDDEMDWEEVDISAPQSATPSEPAQDAVASGPIEITLSRAKKAEDVVKKKGPSNIDRTIRLESHKLHTVALLANASIRNRWLNDPLLHARLMSLTPLPLQTAFLMITKKNQPDAIRRGRLFDTAITRLTEWWWSNFEVEPDIGVRSRTWDEVRDEAASRSADIKGKGRAKDPEQEGEPIRSPKSLMKHLLIMSGSRDVSAQLFTALVRALGVPARLVVSLQSVPWQSLKKPTPKKTASAKGGKGKKQASAMAVTDSDSDDMEEVPIPSTSRGKPGMGSSASKIAPDQTGTVRSDADEGTPARVIKLRRSRPQGRKLGSEPPPSAVQAGLSEYPVFWTEVFSRPDQRWFPVDPVRNLVNTKRKFEPEPTDKTNRMVYVVAFEEDGYARDVTPKYTKAFGARVIKSRPHVRSSFDWWGDINRFLTRPYRLHRDDIEDAELMTNQISEAMPNSVGGFKNHPLYALERHLRREEVIHPRTELGKFRGEPVFPRRSVVPLKTPENWMRQGRKVKEGQQSLKSVKQRAVTLEKRRAQEMAEMEGEEVTQGLYAQWQTEVYRSEPVVDGRIPKNDFGNIDLYVPSMLPDGAVHLPYKGISKVAKKLGFDYAEAVTGFEFRQRRAVPLIDGVVVAAEHEETLLEAYWETAQAAEELERTKKRERVIKRWVRLIQGLRIRQRLQDQYAGEQSANVNGTTVDDEAALEQEAGGFFTSLNDVVQPFHLPRQNTLGEDSGRTTEDPGVAMAVDPPTILDSSQVTSDTLPIRSAPIIISSTDKQVVSVDAGDSLSEAAQSTRKRMPKTVAQLAVENMRSSSRAEASYVKPSATPAPQARLTRSRNSRGQTPATTLGRPPPPHKRPRSASSSGSDHSPTGANSSQKGRSSRRPPQVSVPASARTLRTRHAKTAEQLEAERELEEAFRQAAEENAD